MRAVTQGTWQLVAGLIFTVFAVAFLFVNAHPWAVLVLAFVGGYYLAMGFSGWLERASVKRAIEKKGDEYLRHLEKHYESEWTYWGIQNTNPLALRRKPQPGSQHNTGALG